MFPYKYALVGMAGQIRLLKEAPTQADLVAAKAAAAVEWMVVKFDTIGKIEQRPLDIEWRKNE